MGVYPVVRTLLLAVFVLFLAVPVYAQSVNMRATDPDTNAITDVGDATGRSIQVTVVTDSATATSSLTALQLLDDSVYTEDVPSVEDTKGVGVLFRRHDANTTMVGTDGDWGFGQLTALGSIKVAIIEGAGSGGTSIVDDADFTDSTSSLNPIGAVAESASPSTVTEGDFGALAMTLNRALKTALYRSDGSAVTFNTDVVEDAVETTGVAGPMVLTVRRATAISSAGTDGENATLNTNPQGRLYSAAILEASAITTNSAVPHHIATASTTNATSVKPTSGNVYGYHLVNMTATPYYLRMYNLATAPTCSSASGFVKTIPIPASTTGAGIVVPIDIGEGYSTGIAYCVTGGGSSTDNTNAAAGTYINILYK